MTSLKEHNKKIKELKFIKKLKKNIDTELKTFLKKVELNIIEKDLNKELKCIVYSISVNKSYGSRIIYKDNKGQYINVTGKKKYIINTKISKHNNLYKEVLH